MTDAPAQGADTKARSKRMKLIAAALVVLLGGAAFGVAMWQSQRAYHLATVQPGVLFRDGARSARQFATALDSVHPHTVVSLVDAQEINDPSKPQLGEEAQLCSARGVKLERIKVKLGGWPTSDDLQRFLKIVTDKQNQPVLVHCAQGVRRTAFFVAAFQESVLGYDKGKAKDAILTFGHSDKTINDIRRFIDEYDAKSESVPADLARSAPMTKDQ